jgi:hypothetical protein
MPACGWAFHPSSPRLASEPRPRPPKHASPAAWLYQPALFIIELTFYCISFSVLHQCLGEERISR